MKKLLAAVTIASFMVIFGGDSYAQKTPRVNKRQNIQKHRIRTGVRSGAITRREGRNIRASYKRTKRYEKRARSDGQVTWRERRRMNRMQNRTSRKIYRKKHNHRKR